jgi:B12-binding domain/radical SAM domain protein
MLVVMGVAAPHWVKRGDLAETLSLNSSEPFSQYNAFRYAASCAEKNIGFWANSNWADRAGRNNSIFLMNYLEDELPKFENTLKKLQPNLLLIGTMSLGLPGAVALASLAKQRMGSNIFIVLGGKHITETIYQKNGSITHHPGSPIKLMSEGAIPAVFDLVISGDGEEIIFQVGQIIGGLIKQSKPLKDFYRNADSLLEAKGNWNASWIEFDKISTVISKGIQLSYDELPVPAKLFGVTSNFPVFQRDLTAHTYSDMSKGCKFDCFFCSERRSINGNLVSIKTAPYRLFKQFQEVALFGQENNRTMSAFVEDSTLLGGINSALMEFNNILRNSKLDIKYGGQLTVDLILKSELKHTLKDLAFNGLSYLFWGLETGNEEVASEMSKNTGKQSNWLVKNEKAIQFLKELDIKCGISVLMGIGETHKDRVELLKIIKSWKETYGEPEVISLNWAVQHPLQGFDSEANYTYVEWGTPSNSLYLNVFTKLFGEASVKYPIPGVKLATIEEFEEIGELYLQINKQGKEQQ